MKPFSSYLETNKVTIVIAQPPVIVAKIIGIIPIIITINN